MKNADFVGNSVILVGVYQSHVLLGPAKPALNIYSVDYDVEYGSGMLVIAAESTDQANIIFKSNFNSRHVPWNIEGPHKLPGQITGREPGVIASHHREE